MTVKVISFEIEVERIRRRDGGNECFKFGHRGDERWVGRRGNNVERAELRRIWRYRSVMKG